MRKLSIAALAVIIVAVAIAAAIMAREPSLNEQFSDDALVRLDFVDLYNTAGSYEGPSEDIDPFLRRYHELASAAMSNFDASLRHEGPELCTRGDVIIALYFTSDWIEDAASVQKWLPHVADLAAAQHEGVCRGQAVVLNPRILYTRLGEDQNMAQFAGVESHELVMFVAKPMMMR